MMDIVTPSITAAAPPLARASARPFLALAFGTTWLFQLPYILAQRGVLGGPAERFMPLVVLGFFGPFLIAIALSLRKKGGSGLRALFAPLALGGGIGWHVIALTLPAAIFIVMRAFSAPFSSTELGPWFYPPTDGQHVAAMLVIPFTEQIPWLGFAFPRLRARYGARVAIVVTGLAWSLFHLQKHWFIDPSYASLAFIMVPYMTAGAVVFGWLMLRARGSLFVAVLANAGVYLNNPVQASPGTTTPLLLHAAGFVVAALAVAVGDRAVWQVATDPS